MLLSLLSYKKHTHKSTASTYIRRPQILVASVQSLANTPYPSSLARTSSNPLPCSTRLGNVKVSIPSPITSTMAGLYPPALPPRAPPLPPPPLPPSPPPRLTTCTQLAAIFPLALPARVAAAPRDARALARSGCGDDRAADANALLPLPDCEDAWPENAFEGVEG